MEIALEPLPLLLPRLEHAGAGTAELLETSADLGVQPAVLEGDSRRGGHRVQQLGLVVENRIVHERGNAHAFPNDERCPASHSSTGGVATRPETST